MIIKNNKITIIIIIIIKLDINNFYNFSILIFIYNDSILKNKK